jgi:hypothetical protein
MPAVSDKQRKGKSMKKMAKGFVHGAAKGGVAKIKGSAKKQTLVATPSNVKSLGGGKA